MRRTDCGASEPPHTDRGVEFTKLGENMRNRHKKSKEIKAVSVSKGEKIPAGYTVKETVKVRNQEILISVPDRILKKPELVKELVSQAKFKILFLMGG